MLLGDFFTISSIQKEGDSSKVVLELNTVHPIFEGHFPGRPACCAWCLSVADGERNYAKHS